MLSSVNVLGCEHLMSLVYLPTPEHAVTDAIRLRSQEGSRGQLTRHYAYHENGNEVALLSFDIYDQREFPEIDYLIIYELYVPDTLRNQGIGTRALQAAERFAKELGFRRTFIRVAPLFNTRTQEEMLDWYERRGYKLIPGETDAMDKIV